MPREPFRTSMTYVTLSSLVPPPAGSGPAWVALQNEVRDKAGLSPTETVGKGLKEEILLWGAQAQPLSWPSRVQGVPVARPWLDLWQGAFWAGCFHCQTCCTHTPVNYLLCILQQQLNSINSLCSVFNKHHYHITSQDYANPAKGIIFLPKVTLIYQF